MIFPEHERLSILREVHDAIYLERVKYLPDVYAWIETNQLPALPDFLDGEPAEPTVVVEPTAAGVAGWICSYAGDLFAYDVNDYVHQVGDHYGFNCSRVAVGDGVFEQIESRAQQILELGDDAALELFDSTNSRERTLYILEQLANGTPEDMINWHLGGYRRKEFPPNARGMNATNVPPEGTPIDA